MDEKTLSEASQELLAAVEAGDPVNHPAHYGGATNPYEAIKVIEAWDLDFCTGNALKYISRAGRKGDGAATYIEDLQKAVWYLNRKIQNLRDGG